MSVAQDLEDSMAVDRLVYLTAAYHGDMKLAQKLLVSIESKYDKSRAERIKAQEVQQYEADKRDLELLEEAFK